MKITKFLDDVACRYWSTYVESITTPIGDPDSSLLGCKAVYNIGRAFKIITCATYMWTSNKSFCKHPLESLEQMWSELGEEP